MVQNLSWIIKCWEDITVFQSGEWHDLYLEKQSGAA